MDKKGSGFHDGVSNGSVIPHSFSLIVAMDRNRLIGKGGGLPWRFPADLKRFRSITMGKPIVMGRTTHESIGRPLPGRQNIILTRQRDYQAESCFIVHSIEEIQQAVKGGGEIMVIGGAQVYSLFLPLIDRMYFTLIDAEFEGDSTFPVFHCEDWKEVSRETHQGDERFPFSYSFIMLQRKANMIA